jgi:hypothetical protein
LKLDFYGKNRMSLKENKTKPLYKFKWMIKQAIVENGGSLSYDDILDWMCANFAYFRDSKNNSSWKVVLFFIQILIFLIKYFEKIFVFSAL